MEARQGNIMNFDFSEDQKLLKDQAQKFLEDKCGIDVVRQIMDGEASYDKDLWNGVIEMGWLGAAIPEEFGGLGLGHLELCVIAEELGRALAPVPFSSTVYLGAEALLQAGTTAQKNAILPKVAAGEAIGCLATSDKSGPLAPKNVSCRFADGKISGTKIAVPDGDVADFAIVLVKTGSGDAKSDMSLALVDLNGAGISREAARGMDLTRSYAAITFDGASAELLGAEGNGWAIMDDVFDAAAILFAFEQVGGATRAMMEAKEYALGRIAFGRSIASFQAIKHKLADIYIKTELARSNAYYGAWALSTKSDDLSIAAAGARVAASEAYDFASKEDIQTHGGMGFTWEFDCHIHYRRARALSLNIGSPRVWKNKLINRLNTARAA
jgi:alkylation response protein AidB-like acyl-CoA dehydrogenase